jgi:hypothetical protein
LTAEHLVERLEVELATAVAEGERHKRNAECYACEAGDPDMDGVQDTKLSRAEAEVERLHNEIARPKYETLRQLADAVERNEQLKAEVERLRMAVGLATTAVPTMEMDPDHPIEMMQCVVTEVERLRGLLTEWIPRHSAACCTPTPELGSFPPGPFLPKWCRCNSLSKRSRAALEVVKP